MGSTTGYWTGEFSGTNTGRLVLDLKHSGTRVTGQGRFHESSLGLYKFNVNGEAQADGDDAFLVLTPGDTSSAQLGKIEVRARLISAEELTGRWTSTLGLEGAFSVCRAKVDSPRTDAAATPSIFIAHGHDEAMKEKVARVIEKLGLTPIILHEQASRSMTIVEKFERYANQSSFAIALFTPDDIGYAATKPESKGLRARQNVVLELGYFFGKLGRDRVVVLYKGDLELPSDIGGIVYTLFDDKGAWRHSLAKEFRAVGIPADSNRLDDP